jgi:cellulose synthase/poly-beta-1,6-N-acetylglucosamine synthase-like glycosyltransferase
MMSIEYECLPKIAVIIAAYNESQCLEQKIINTLSLDYDKDKLNVVVITDGSNDNSLEIINKFPQITHMHKNERKGKFAAMKRAIHKVEESITIFTDANAILNKKALINIVKCFQFPSVGVVAGEKRVHFDESVISSAASEGLYWQYESKMKQLDADIYSVVGAAGELFAIRTNLFEDVGDNIILDDFMLTLKINLKGYRTEYAPNAFAKENASANIREEYSRKVRISAGGWQSIILLINDGNLLKFPLLTFQLISRRILRWMLAPILLPLIFIINMVLLNSGIPCIQLLFFVQCSFYIMALVGLIMTNKKDVSAAFRIPFYFTFMHIAALLGLARYISGKQSVLWKKVQRLN